MNIKKIEEIIRLMEKHDLTEVTIEEDGKKVHLRKGSGGHIIEKTFAMPPSLATRPSSAGGEQAAKTKEENAVEIKAPMVGTFYASPSPDAKPFVAVDSAVKEGDVLCIIEAMKLMNEIKSEIKGKIIDVLIKNGDPVEFGQVLFLVEPT